MRGPLNSKYRQQLLHAADFSLVCMQVMVLVGSVIFILMVTMLHVIGKVRCPNVHNWAHLSVA